MWYELNLCDHVNRIVDRSTICNTYEDAKELLKFLGYHEEDEHYWYPDDDNDQDHSAWIVEIKSAFDHFDNAEDLVVPY